MPQVLIVGCGFLGETAADFFFRNGWEVLGICGSEESAKRLAAKSYPVLAQDITRPVSVGSAWQAPDTLVFCASSGRGGADAYRAIYCGGLTHLLDAINPRQIIFTGSTSVYAQTDGGWVDEKNATLPDRETGQILLEAEKLVLGREGIVLRLAGLYGPGRSVLMRKFLSGEAVLEDGGGRWINQIHRDDAACAIQHLAETHAAAGVYNGGDDTPSAQRQVYQWLADHFQRPLPPEGPADRSRKRGWTNKRVSNGKLRVTGWKPEYASYADAIPGLAAAGY